MSTNLITLIKADHKKVDNLYQQYNSIQPGTPEVDMKTKQELVWNIIYELCVHSLAEEEILYPILRQKYTARDNYLC